MFCQHSIYNRSGSGAVSGGPKPRRKTGRESKMRLNFEFAEDRIGDLKDLQKITGTTNMKELADNAFTILEWAVKETKDGNDIAAVNDADQTYRILVMPLLQRVARKFVGPVVQVNAGAPTPP